MRRLKQRIEALRQQPEAVRLRAVTYLTIVAGVVLVILWLVVLLPLQLYFQRNDREPAEETEQSLPPVEDQAGPASAPDDQNISPINDLIEQLVEPTPRGAADVPPAAQTETVPPPPASNSELEEPLPTATPAPANASTINE
jgi:cytoskeletal protein RodZ